LFVLAAITAACGPGGVGDPCTIPNPALTPGSTNVCPGEVSCFVGGEIYIETRSLQCRTHVCMIYHWDQMASLNMQATNEFCTCKCGGPGDTSTFCQCPGDFSCVTAFLSGEPGIQGAYCIRNVLADAGSAH
jgi:hypothetical protein